MQGLLLFTLSCSDQSDECRSHSPFSPPVNYVSMICPLDLQTRTWKNIRDEIIVTRRKKLFEGKILFDFNSTRESKEYSPISHRSFLNLNSNTII